MTATNDNTPVIAFRVPADLHHRAVQLARARNFQSVSELMRNLLREDVERNAARLQPTPEPKKGGKAK